MAFHMVAIVLRMVILVFRFLYRRSPKLWGGGGRVCVVLVVGAVIVKKTLFIRCVKIEI